ncbi:hypothetical protein BASA81_006907 [Batrachochytrium salamandrivorans]|nr:hypothetical protein BASA81_006907 [Batrachochytrium salamandrivorans]
MDSLAKGSLSTLLSWLPSNLLSPIEVAKSLSAFCVLVLFPVTVLLPIALANPLTVPALGYIGRIVPVICVMGLGQIVFVRWIKRACSLGLGFDRNELLPHENFSEQTVKRVWRSALTAFIQLRSNKLAVSREAVVLQLEKVMGSEEFATDLARKMRLGFAHHPSTYYEQKLLGILFPATSRELQRASAGMICRVGRRRRWWCWKQSLVWAVMFVGMVLIPLAILVPISVTLNRGQALPLPFFSNQTLWPSESSNQMAGSTFVAIFVFSVLFPVVYLVLAMGDLVWWAKQRKCGRGGMDKRKQVAAGKKDDGTARPNKAKFNDAKRGKQQLPKTVEGLRRANELAAQSDLKSAFDEVDNMFKFEWSANQSAAAAAPNSIASASSPDSSLLPVFLAMARFYKESDSPAVRLIRARALAGQIRLGIFEFLKSPTDKDVADTVSVAHRLLESEPMESVLLDRDIVYSQFLYQVFQSVDFNSEPIQAFEVWEQELIGTFDFVNSLLFGFQLEGDLDEGERSFCRIIFRLARAPPFPRKKELEYLAWIGLHRVRLARNPSSDKVVSACEELHWMLLVQERERVLTSDPARRMSFYHLINHPQVKRSIFWLAMFKHSSTIESLWAKHENYRVKVVLNSEVDRLQGVQAKNQEEILALLVFETERPLGKGTLGDTDAPLVDLFASQLWDRVNNALCVHDHVEWISPREERWVETLLAQTQACDLLFRFKQSPTPEALASLRLVVAGFEQRFRDVSSDRIAFLFMWIELNYQKSRVNQEWHQLLLRHTHQHRRFFNWPFKQRSKPPANNNATTTTTAAKLEETFRRGFSFTDAAFANHREYVAMVEKLHAQACAGLIEMHVQRGSLDKAQEWADKMQQTLPLQSISLSASLKRALRDLQRAVLTKQLGRLWYGAYWLWLEHPRLMTHFMLLWLLFILPLALGINLLAHSSISSQPEDAFFFQWFGILLPLFYVLLRGLCWTLVPRVRWFEEREANEELEEAVSNVICAANEDHDLWQGGESPHWELGDHVVANAGGKRPLFPAKRGRRLVLYRVGVAVVLFAVLPIVIIPPSLPWATNPAQVSAMWVIVIAFPLCTVAFVTFCLLRDALPRPVSHGLYVVVAWVGLFFLFPLLCGIPVLQGEMASGVGDGAKIGALWVWLLLGPGVSLVVGLHWAWRHWAAVRYWCRGLAWREKSLREICRFAMQLGTLAAVAFPWLSLFFLLGMRTAQGSGGVAMFIAVAAFESIACVGCVVLCTAGTKLRYIHPEMAASSVLPALFLSFGSFVIFEAAAASAASGGGSSHALRGRIDVALWSCGLQLVCAIWYAMEAQQRHAERQRFGYFPEDWELFDPTARFVVEQAKHVPFLDHVELTRELRGMVPSATTMAATTSRREMERLLEEAYREEVAAQLRQDELISQQMAELEKRYAGERLSQLVFSRIANGEEGEGALLNQFCIIKWRHSLNHALRRHYYHSSNEFAHSHLVQVLPSKVRVVNMLLGVVSSVPFAKFDSLAWISEDNLVGEVKIKHPEAVLRLVEVVVAHRRVRTWQFDSAQARNDFIQLVFQHTSHLLHYSFDGSVDRLQRKTGARQPEA